MKYAYILEHGYDYGENDEHMNAITLGIYSNEEKAEKALKQYALSESFREYPLECFNIDRYAVDTDTGWIDGFVSV